MPSLNTFVLEVDWDGDGDFGDTGEDVTLDVVSCVSERGRDYASSLIGRSIAGTLTAELRNHDGKYSRFNSSSALFGMLLPNRKVRVRSTAPTAATLWTGYLDNVMASAGGLPSATLTASGPFKKLSGQNSRVSPPALEDVQTSDVIEAILDAAGWPDGDRAIATGDVEIKAWYVENVEALRELQAMEDTELGFLYEGLAWDVGFRNRYHRDVSSLTSQGSFSDAAGASLPYLMDIELSDPLREVFNQFEATVTPLVVGLTEEDLWTLFSELPSLAPSESRTYIATVGAGVAYVQDWTTPVVGTDITQTGVSNGDIGVSVVKTARTMEITVTNNHGSASASITLLKARGVAVTKQDPFKVTVEDATSQVAYERRTWPLVSPWYHNSANALGSGGLFLARNKDPHPAPLLMSLPAGTDDSLFAQAVQRDLSQRITVTATGPRTKFGVSQDFYIESIRHSWGARRPLETTWQLSEAVDDPGWFIVGTDELNDSGRVIAW